jgi:hypothetical protein
MIFGGQCRVCHRVPNHTMGRVTHHVLIECGNILTRIMKHPLGRELALLSLPVLLLGGVALSGRQFSNPFDPGPIRIEYLSLDKVELNPYYVWRGYDWGARINLRVRGNTGLPTSLEVDENYPSVATLSNRQLEYLQNGVWKQSSDRVAIRQEDMTSSNNWKIAPVTIRVRLKSVPADADEVRMRGTYTMWRTFKGTIPPGWRPPQNLLASGAGYTFQIASQPFEATIKGPNDPMPSPQVSRQSYLQLVKAKWVYNTWRNPVTGRTSSTDRIALHLRETSGQNVFASFLSLQVADFVLKDANGKPITLYMERGSSRSSPVTFRFWMPDRQSYFPKFPRNEAGFSVLNDYAPRGGWSRVKQPMTLQAKVSDGKSWPLQIRVRLKRRSIPFLRSGADVRW